MPRFVRLFLALPSLALEGWQVLDDRIELFDAPGGTVKRSRTSIARRPRSDTRVP
jgi:hypothetical protein